MYLEITEQKAKSSQKVTDFEIMNNLGKGKS